MGYRIHGEVDGVEVVIVECTGDMIVIAEPQHQCVVGTVGAVPNDPFVGLSMPVP
jgi:hypothetical protein